MMALDELVAEGWIETRPRQGNFISQTLPDHYFQSRGAHAKTHRQPRLTHRIVRSFRQGTPVYPPPKQKITYNFKSGLADLSRFPVKEFQTCLADVLPRHPRRVQGFGAPLGSPRLIAEFSTYLRRVRALTGRRVVITHGSQEAIYITGQLPLPKGDRVVVEEPGYPLAWQAFKVAGAILIPIGTDRQGMHTDELRKIVSRHKVRLIYVTPLHQFPTTVTMSVDRRLELYQIAARHGIPILEDDYDHEYHYRSYSPSPLAADDPMGIVIYVSTLPKTLFPAIRLGFMVVPEGFAATIERYRNITTRQPCLINQDTVARWIACGGFERHLRRMRRLYEQRRDAMIATLVEAKAQGLHLTWQTPDGGMAIWFNTHRNSAHIVGEAEKKGILLLNEALFRNRKAGRSHLRLGFAHLTADEIRAGMEGVYEVIRQQPGGRGSNVKDSQSAG